VPDRKGENRGRDTEKKEKAQSASKTQIRDILHRRFHASSRKEIPLRRPQKDLKDRNEQALRIAGCG
jgi:hypothetical protein